ncbi:hypothetical protein [Methylobacterium sp. 77]|uniref:hypothetical protein n=1 Tax=Methylobacterium sp. 77 TaxID=1101192 RepID=UPI00036094DA|nr:hypothetical protein [Methylobacterium sp. 77]
MMASRETGHDVAEYEPGGYGLGADVLAAAPRMDAADTESDRRTVASEPVTLAESLIQDEGWSPLNFDETGPNPPYLRIGGKLRMTLTDYEPCFSSHSRDRILFRSKVSMAEHLQKYDQMMVDPLAFEECFGPGQGTDATFPFGAWLTIRKVGFSGIELWDKRRGDVVLPLEPLSVASAIWLRHADTPRWMLT